MTAGWIAAHTPAAPLVACCPALAHGLVPDEDWGPLKCRVLGREQETVCWTPGTCSLSWRPHLLSWGLRCSLQTTVPGFSASSSSVSPSDLSTLCFRGKSCSVFCAPYVISGRTTALFAGSEMYGQGVKPATCVDTAQSTSPAPREMASEGGRLCLRRADESYQHLPQTSRMITFKFYFYLSDTSYEDSLAHPSVHLSTHCPLMRLSICPSVHPSIHPSVCPSIRLSIHPFLYFSPFPCRVPCTFAGPLLLGKLP